MLIQGNIKSSSFKLQEVPVIKFKLQTFSSVSSLELVFTGFGPSLANRISSPVTRATVLQGPVRWEDKSQTREVGKAGLSAFVAVSFSGAGSPLRAAFSSWAAFLG
jgi:hypothetical protein